MFHRNNGLYGPEVSPHKLEIKIQDDLSNMSVCLMPAN
jgi:hypothetical protein